MKSSPLRSSNLQIINYENMCTPLEYWSKISHLILLRVVLYSRDQTHMQNDHARGEVVSYLNCRSTS